MDSMGNLGFVADAIADLDASGCNDLRIYAHEDVPEAHLEFLRDVHVALGGGGVHLRRRTALDPGDYPESGLTDGEVRSNHIELPPRRPSFDIEVCPKAERIHGHAHEGLQSPDAGKVYNRDVL